MFISLYDKVVRTFSVPSLTRKNYNVAHSMKNVAFMHFVIKVDIHVDESLTELDMEAPSIYL